ncbi:MAG: rod shape-determining protein MreD [Salinisphaera sp.]|nr:rod shape-determining protein MreD [Salinisphaera sp.]MDN5938733.1 rod shape-determining protein MreD [Salinisphaera sp.]
MTTAMQPTLLACAASLVMALLLTLVPLPVWAALARPSFYAATVLFWALYLPRHFGVIAAWCCGLFLDASYAAPLGQYALALALASFVVIKMRGLLWVLPPLQQAIALLPALLLYEFVLFWIDGVSGRGTDPLWRWLPVLSTAAIWPLWSACLERLVEIEVKS